MRKKESDKSIVGKVWGRLTAINPVIMEGTPRPWLFKCSCGQKTKTSLYRVKNGGTRSCGCLHKSKGGVTNTNTHIRWTYMIKRCEDPKHKSYASYGGRGIKVCKRWYKFENFLADMGHPPKGKSLDRIDNDGDYCKKNCRWVTQSEQCRNTRQTVFVSFKGKVWKAPDLADHLKLGLQQLYARMRGKDEAFQRVNEVYKKPL